MSFGRIAASFAAVVFGVGLALGAATSASAHDSLIDADPRPGAVLEDAPEQITLIYSGELQALGKLVVVVDSDGRDWVDGESSNQGTTLIQPLEAGMPEGSYQVRWQVVSSDGHPISGFYDFAVGEPTPGGIAAPTEAGAHEHPDAGDDEATEGSGAALWVVIASSLAALAAAVTTAIVVIRRRRTQG